MYHSNVVIEMLLLFRISKIQKYINQAKHLEMNLNNTHDILRYLKSKMMVSDSHHKNKSFCYDKPLNLFTHRDSIYPEPGLKITGFASQFASENQPVANQINI